MNVFFYVFHLVCHLIGTVFFVIHNMLIIFIFYYLFYIGLHNGHTVVGGEYQSILLKEDRDDRDVLLTKDGLININGYVPHELMALVMLIEYEVGVPVQQRTLHNTNSILNSTSLNSKVVTVLTLGVSIYIPYNGEKVQIGRAHV